MRVVVVSRALMISLLGAVGANAFGGPQRIAPPPAADATILAVTSTPARFDPLQRPSAAAGLAGPDGLTASFEHIAVVRAPLGMQALRPSLPLRHVAGDGVAAESSDDPVALMMPLESPREPLDIGRQPIALHEPPDESRSVAAPLPAAAGPGFAVLGIALIRRTLRRRRRI